MDATRLAGKGKRVGRLLAALGELLLFELRAPRTPGWSGGAAPLARRMPEGLSLTPALPLATSSLPQA